MGVVFIFLIINYFSIKVVWLSLAPALLILAQRFRIGAEFTYESLKHIVVNSHSELFSVLSFTLDTLKASVLLYASSDVEVSLFARIT